METPDYKTFSDFLTDSDIAFLEKHQTHFQTHQALSIQFLTFFRKYPNLKRGDFANAFGKTLNYLYPKPKSGEEKNEFHYSTTMREGKGNA
tara:strand:- start:493 stop:765 length:273 start_codon:yes stop_codon:yes gene_type:complete